MKLEGDSPSPSRWSRAKRVLGFISHELLPFRGSLLFALFALLLHRASALVAPALLKVVIDDVLGEGRAELLVTVALALSAAALLQAGAGFFMTRLLVRSSEALVAKLRQRAHAHLLELKVAFFDRSQAGALAHRILTESAEIEAFAGPFLLEIAGSALTALFALGVLVAIDPGLALTVSAFLLLLGLIAAAHLRYAFRHAGDQNRIQAELSGHLAESFSAIRIVKAFRTEPRERRLFEEGTTRLLDIALRGARVSLRMTALSTTLFGLATALVVHLASSRVLSGELTLGEMMTFLACLGFLLAPLMQLATMGPGLLRAASAMERTMALFELEREGAGREHELPAVRGEIAFEGVSFAYEGEPVLKDISFRASPGQVTAIVGPSGAGKSTILALLAGFYEPSSGRILVDGHDLKTLRLSAYRKSLALVPQEPLLFEGTIADNIQAAHPDATADEIRQACRMAGVDRFVSAWADGYRTRVGERGTNLSAGQKQRVSIARALLKDAPLLLLDEPTSALDAESEAYLEPVFALCEGRTTIIVSHRLSTIRRADEILFIDDGQILERGTHASLMAARGRYFEMYADEADVTPKQADAS